MTESGSGQRDDQGRPTPPGSDQPGSDDDYTPSASWESSRSSGWENTTPYDSPFARPDSPGSGPTFGPAAEDGPWPTYPDPSQPGGGQPQAGDAQPPGYQQPTGYGSAGDPYAPSGAGSQGPYGQPAGYGEQAPYGQPAQEQYGQEQYSQEQYGQPPGYPAQPGYGVNPYQQPVYTGYVLPNHPQATTALILGIVGLALCPFVGIAGFVMGGRVRREIDAAPTQWGGRGLATGGWVLGIISIVYAALLVVYFVGIVVVAIASSV